MLISLLGLLLLLRWLFPVWEISVAGKLSYSMGAHPIWEPPSAGGPVTLDWSQMGFHTAIIFGLMLAISFIRRTRS